ncbi:MAG TPA: hypothetical protein ENK26_13600 [Gammaproteobacteria bacterium]|nr:hypothetical protein [Gammaproteobacteria bacterium]
MQNYYFALSVLILAAMLFFPVSKLIWVFAVRRMQARIGRDLNPMELEGQKARARFLAVFVTLAFSWLFNNSLLGGAGG